MSKDLIAAVATPAGSGGVGIVRASGARLEALIPLLKIAALPPPRAATCTDFISASGDCIDSGIALYFPAPASYTGEAVLELQAHGGMVVMQQLLARCVSLGARLAAPGEFTLRAYLNGKLDLAQAEAVADLINAGSAAAAAAAARSLSGDFSRRINAFLSQLRAARVNLEGDLDFSDEDAQTTDAAAAAAELSALAAQAAALLEKTRRGARLVGGADVLLIGAPNTGKSSLLNKLAGEDAAIVSSAPGTTRDLIERQLVINGLVMRVTDSAGLRDSAQEIEQEGMRRALARAARADIIIRLQDRQTPPPPLPPRDGSPPAVIEVCNKIDLSGEPAGARENGGGDGGGGRICYLSAKTGAGLEALKNALCEAAGYAPDTSLFSARARHVAALQAAHVHLQKAAAAAPALPELAAAWLREADLQLQTICGGYSEEDLLGDIFSTFCIGK